MRKQSLAVQIDQQWNCNWELLTMMAEATVPILVHDLEQAGGLRDEHIEWLKSQADIIGSEGDALVCNIKHETAKKSAILFRCLSYMAFFDGGVKFMGTRFMSREQREKYPDVS